MKITRACGYALHALAYLAREKPDRPVPSHIIAEAEGVPERFLLKVLKPLVSVRMLRSVKGPNGGYILSRKPDGITLLEIVEAVDGPIRGQAPPVASGSAAALDRRLESVCDAVAGEVRGRLAVVSLAALARKGK